MKSLLRVDTHTRLCRLHMHIIIPIISTLIVSMEAVGRYVRFAVI